MACGTEGCLQVAAYFFPRFCWNIHLWVPSSCLPLSPRRCLKQLVFRGVEGRFPNAIQVKSAPSQLGGDWRRSSSPSVLPHSVWSGCFQGAASFVSAIPCPIDRTASCHLHIRTPVDMGSLRLYTHTHTHTKPIHTPTCTHLHTYTHTHTPAHTHIHTCRHRRREKVDFC